MPFTLLFITKSAIWLQGIEVGGCPQKVDAIIKAREQIFANFKIKEERTTAITILANHWRNQRSAHASSLKMLEAIQDDDEASKHSST